MAKKPAPMRRCIGSATFGIEAHEAPENEFPTQPGQKDGLGRMCHAHWRQYTNALRKASIARKAAEPPALSAGCCESPGAHVSRNGSLHVAPASSDRSPHSAPQW